MAKGITQDQVNAAADALVTAGDKPTVEKIRQALGTGSPNTVTRMLETWRGTLAQRLQEVIQLPDLPAEVGQAVLPFWQVAVRHAEAAMRERLAHEQNALLAEHTALAQERKIWEIALADAQATAAEIAAKLTNTEVQLTERQTLLAHTETQRLDLLQQRDRLQQQYDRGAEESTTLRTQLAAAESKAAMERDQANSHIRQIEDRASREIDHARQAMEALQQRMASLQRDHDKALKHLVAKRDATLAALRTAEQQLATVRGRAEALQQQLAQRPPGKTHSKSTSNTGKRPIKKASTLLPRRKSKES